MMKRSPMPARTTPLVRGTSQLKRSLMPRTKPMATGLTGTLSVASVQMAKRAAKKPKSAKPRTFRSEAYLAIVRTLDCVCCGRDKRFTQAAHSNQIRFSKAKGLKASDASAMALCAFPAVGVPGCHELHDQGGKRTKAEWWALEYHRICLTVSALLMDGKLAGDIDVIRSIPIIVEDWEATALHLVRLIETEQLQVAK